MKYVHPEIVMGEPIPEIEPRVDQGRLAVVRRLNFWYRWCLVFAMGLIGVSVVLRPGLIVGVGMTVAVLLLWMVPIFRPSMRAELRRIRKANRRVGFSDSEFWNIPFRDQAENQILIWSMMAIAPALVGAGGGFGNLLLYPGMYAFMGGFGVLVYGFYAREPGPISCEECSYPLVGLTLPCKCPECGYWLLHPKYTTDCPRIRSPWFLRVGVVMVLLGSGVVYASFARPAAFYVPIPRSVLLRLAPTDQEAFERLISKPMSQGETDELIEKLVSSDIHRDGAYQSYRQRRWLGQQFAAGLLSGDQTDRVLELADDLSIKAPATGRVGESITLGLDGGGDFDSAEDMKPRYYFGGFIIGDDPTPHQRSVNPHSISLITRILPTTDLSKYPESYLARIQAMKPPVYIFTPVEPGVVTIRVRLILAILPKGGKGGGESIYWGNGNRRFQSIPLWMRVVDLEHAIIVNE